MENNDSTNETTKIEVKISLEVADKLQEISEIKETTLEATVVDLINRGIAENDSLIKREKHLEELKKMMSEHDMPEGAMKTLESAILY